jgi:hypothetical protein
LEELDLSFNTRTIFGESVISNLLPFLQHDSQLRILRLKACEANYDIARSIRNGVDTLLMCNNTLVILDIAENRCLPVKIPETNSTILNLGASSETHANAANLLRNKNLYEERVFIKKVLRYKFGRNEE